MTVHISIGNSDDKLTQAEWSRYVSDVNSLVKTSAAMVHGYWHSMPDAPWQNACWAFDLSPKYADGDILKATLAVMAKHYGQDAIAWNESETEFVGPKPPEPLPPLGQVPVYSEPIIDMRED